MTSPSMVHRSGDTLVVRSVVSGNQLYVNENEAESGASGDEIFDPDDENRNLPECKIRRNYSCNSCHYFTQNPRDFLYHLRDVHKEKMKVYECPHCLYASKHFQKLLRHMKMVHSGYRAMDVADGMSQPKVRRKRKRPQERVELDEEDNGNANETADETSSKMSPDLKCSLCPFTTRYQGQLTRHERQEHIKTKFFRCSKCSYVTHIKARFTKHVKYHSMPMIKCDLCDFRTPYKWNLDRHYKNHNGHGAFRCSACNFTADIKQSLTVHEMNHHVPPVGQAGLGVGRRRNKVGASDTTSAEELIVDAATVGNLQDQIGEPDFTKVTSLENSDALSFVKKRNPKIKISFKKPKLTNNTQGQNERHNFETDFIHPDDIIHHSNGNIYIKNKCKLCNYKSAWESEMAKHEQKVHNIVRGQHGVKKAKKNPRPIPNLIPIQNATPMTANSVLKIPVVLNRNVEESMISEKDLNDLCANSANSALRDFASLFGDDVTIEAEKPALDSGAVITPISAPQINSTPSAIFKKKNASFFDKLKEKLMTDAGETCNLTCRWCGHVSKCLSESAGHQKTCGKQQTNISILPVSGHNTSSTRCQYCRQRCKSSIDLHNHLQQCLEANKPKKDPSEIYYEKPDITIKLEEERPDSIEPHPMENVVFVWNNISPQPEEDQSIDLSMHVQSPVSEESVLECETVPENTTTPVKMPTHGNDIDLVTDGRRVFKCPHCSFWATTASRFHVHIVGHLNKKPFECSLCAYRSNWRWDITKHIRLKSVRDPEHEKARVLMTDETGRRNYSKYNKYLTQLRPSDSPSESSLHPGRKSKSAEAALKRQSEIETKSMLNLPKLVRAPNNADFLSATNNPLRPPPPLKAANDTYFQNLTEGIKKKNSDAKKTLFKCKKCNFRDASRENILMHVKGHYSQENNVGNAESDEASVLRGNAPFRCGHCHQVSNWKHVIQRHCRLKHSGDVRVVIGGKNGSTEKIEVDDQSDEPDHVDVMQNGEFKCQQCPYSVNSQSDFDIHLNMHVPKLDYSMKCYFCPYYVMQKFELYDHLKLHGVTNPEDYVNRAMQGRDLSSPTNFDGFFKRYKCVCCPYVSNSKSQFLYHKQFHRHRGGSFKCELCNYTVTKRHLLHQHLKVHGIAMSSQRGSVKSGSDHESDAVDSEDIAFDEFEEVSSPLNYMIEDVLEDVPLVWVSRDGKFSKMFKCRYCPHVNVRKVNIQEHEKMHSNRKSSPRSEEHHCPECNYVCNNAGVLSSHLKVHQFLYGQIHCLVDQNKTDEEQISELTKLLNINDSDCNNQIKCDDNFSIEEHEMLSSDDLIEDRVLHFCEHCPARFLYEKEYNIHNRFHGIRLFYRCDYCSYAARQRPHLLAHNKVHTDEYQQQTKELQSEYITSKEHQPSRVTSVTIDGLGEEQGPVWVVISSNDKQMLPETIDAKPTSSPVKSNKNFACVKCPARFFKNDLLQYHMTLHGCSNPYKCKYCDYAARTSSNLQKHARIHQPDSVNEQKPSLIGTVPLSGTDLFQQKSEAEQRSIAAAENMITPEPVYIQPSPKHVDPQFGTLMHGNPKFIYPTYIKNGRMKEKRYKCHKCPSAFEKREQYKVHLSLHGSKQRYKCENCDYSVKYYANYMQHTKKHQMNADAQAIKRSESTDDGLVEETPIKQEAISPSFPKLAIKSLSSSSSKRGPLKLSVADRQTLMILQQRRSSASSTKEAQSAQVVSAEDKKMFWCPHCPYTNHRRDAVDNHVNRHICVSGVRSNYTCDHCDYTVPQSHFLRDHVKIHFTGQKRHQPEGYMVCHNLQLSTHQCDDESSETKSAQDESVVFQDCGDLTELRFQPKIKAEILDAHNNNTIKIFVNPENGEVIEPTV